MPKGVEHVVTVTWHTVQSKVIHSLMPKGVEHGLYDADESKPAESDSFVDAERR